MEKIAYEPIGIIHTPFSSQEGVPIQPCYAKGVEGTVEVFSEFAAGLKDLAGFSHIILLYHFHLSQGFSLRVKPFLDTEIRGLFATRAPNRPNPIGFSTVRLFRVEEAILHVAELDIVDGTPLLDIKPWVPQLEPREREVKIGWLTDKVKEAPRKMADRRFITS